jgi:hypothetical protein
VLAGWLTETLPHEPRIFVDQVSIDDGDVWPMRLEQALLKSRLLVAICSPSYFRSKWCVAELISMLERDKVLGLRSPERPWSLVLPIRFHDGSSFPDIIQQLQMRDFRKFNVPVTVFQETRKYPKFIREVQDFADAIAVSLDRVPDWNAGWPAVRPDTSDTYELRIPRL